MVVKVYLYNLSKQNPHQPFFAEISRLETLKFDVKCQIFKEPFLLEK